MCWKSDFQTVAFIFWISIVYFSRVIAYHALTIYANLFSLIIEWRTHKSPYCICITRWFLRLWALWPLLSANVYAVVSFFLHLWDLISISVFRIALGVWTATYNNFECLVQVLNYLLSCSRVMLVLLAWVSKIMHLSRYPLLLLVIWSC